MEMNCSAPCPHRKHWSKKFGTSETAKAAKRTMRVNAPVTASPRAKGAVVAFVMVASNVGTVVLNSIYRRRRLHPSEASGASRRPDEYCQPNAPAHLRRFNHVSITQPWAAAVRCSRVRQLVEEETTASCHPKRRTVPRGS